MRVLAASKPWEGKHRILWMLGELSFLEFPSISQYKKFSSIWGDILVLIGHFRVPKTLTLKMRLGAQPFLWNEVYLHENEKWFPYQRLSTYPRFEKEARGNTEMAHWLLHKNKWFVLISRPVRHKPTWPSWNLFGWSLFLKLIVTRRRLPLFLSIPTT